MGLWGLRRVRLQCWLRSRCERACWGGIFVLWLLTHRLVICNGVVGRFVLFYVPLFLSLYVVVSGGVGIVEIIMTWMWL